MVVSRRQSSYSSVVPRWLIPLLTALALLGSSVSSWAAAGLRSETSCCCPDQSKCKCHDHDMPGPGATPKLERCTGDAGWVAPATVAVVTPEPPVMPEAVQAAAPAPADPLPLPDARSITPEPPPF